MDQLLTISNVTVADAGQYKCTIKFRLVTLSISTNVTIESELSNCIAIATEYCHQVCSQEGFEGFDRTT